MRTLGYAVLGLLAAEPLTGYQVSRRMARPIGYLWTARHSQIYPELRSLEQAGLVRHRVEDGRGPRDTKRYWITGKGKNALRSWVASPLEPPESKSELMLRVRALWLVSPTVARELIEAARDRHVQRRAAYAVEEATFGDPGLLAFDSAAFSSYATLRCGIGHEDQAVGWCDWLLARIPRG